MMALQPALTQTFDGTIWRLEIDELTDDLIVEIREEQEKQVSFSSVNLLTGKLNFTRYKTAERWLTGLEAAYNGVVLLHYYKHESGPEHRGIIAIDARSSAELWSNYNVAFDHLSTNGPVLYNTNIQPKKLMVADVRTGLTLHPYHQSIDLPVVNSIKLPETEFPLDFKPGVLPQDPFGNMVHYLNHNNYIIVSLHALKGTVLQQHLYVLQGAAIVYHDLLNHDIQKMQPEAFVLHKNRLIFIKNKSELKVLNL